MGRKKRGKPLLGRAEDIDQPGLDHIEEVRAIIRSFLREYREGIADLKTTRRRLRYLKRVIRKSPSMSDLVKNQSLYLVDEALRELKNM